MLDIQTLAPRRTHCLRKQFNKFEYFYKIEISGIKVSALCPQLVDTDMVRSFGKLPENHPLLKDGLLSADVVAEEAIQGINKEKFLILPHKEVAKYIQGKAFDYDAWIEAVRKLVP